MYEIPESGISWPGKSETRGGGGEGGLTPRIVRLGASQLVGSRCRPGSQKEPGEGQ
jgi:hypothetical protein